MVLRALVVFTYAAALFGQAEQEPDYGGPSVLSRGMGSSVTARHANIEFRPRAGVNGICDNGLTAVTVDSSGHVPNVVACGIEGSAGVSGFHTWKKTSLGLDYSGNYRHYPNRTYYDSIDQMLSMGLSHQLSKRATFSLRESAGTYSRNYFGFGGSGFYEPSSLPTPAANLFDAPVYFGSASGDLMYALSARWSVSAGGVGYAARYRSDALYGATSYGAHGDFVYRLSRFSSIGGAYQYVHTDFTRRFGAYDYHAMGLLYASRLSRTWELSLQVGVGRVESLSLERVAVDPAVAAITGQSAGILAAYHLNYLPDISAGLTKAFRNGSLGFRYVRTVSAGNGVYLASASDYATASYTYTGVRQWAFGASGGYSKLKSIQQSIGVYEGYTGGVGVVRTLGRGLQLAIRMDERHYSAGYSGFRRDALRATLGFLWSPGDIPVTLW